MENALDTDIYYYCYRKDVITKYFLETLFFWKMAFEEKLIFGNYFENYFWENCFETFFEICFLDFF